MFNWLQGGKEKAKKGIAHGAKKKVFWFTTKTTLKFTIWIIVASVIVVLGLSIWALYATGHLINEGEFDQVYGGEDKGEDARPPGSNVLVDYNDITNLINAVDMDKLKEKGPMALDELLPGAKDKYLVPKSLNDVYTLLRSYLLFAEICSNSKMKPETGDVAMQPYMMYGVWYHENKCQLWDSATHDNTLQWDPYVSWGTQLSSQEMGKGPKKTWASLFGQALSLFNIFPANRVSLDRGIRYVSGPVELHSPSMGHGSGVPILYRSKIECPTLGEDQRIVATITPASNWAGKPPSYAINMTSEIEASLQYKFHDKYKWEFNKTERPSGLFFPDAAATAANGGRLLFSGRNVYTTYKEDRREAIRSYASSQGLTNTKFEEYATVGRWFSVRAAKEDIWKEANGCPAAEMVGAVNDKLESGYFWGSSIMQEYGSFTNAYANVDQMLFGAEVTNTNMSMCPGGLINKELIDRLATESDSDLEPCLAKGDWLRSIMSGKMIEELTKVVASRAATDFPKPLPPDGNGGPGVPGGGVQGSINYDFDLGYNVMDKDINGVCDSCNQSIFKASTSGCQHTPSKKVFFPVAGPWQFSNIEDYHFYRSECKWKGHDGSHEAYDINDSSRGQPLIAPIPGELSYAVDGSRGFRAIQYCPTKANPRFVFIYAHMREGIPGFTNGLRKPVNAGEQVGVMGATGGKWGEHLHFEVRKRIPPWLTGEGFNYMEGADKWQGTGPSPISLGNRGPNHNKVNISPYVFQLNKDMSNMDDYNK